MRGRRARLIRSLVSFTKRCLGLTPSARLSVAFISGGHVRRVGQRCHGGSRTASIVDFTLGSSVSSSFPVGVRDVSKLFPAGVNSVVVSARGALRRTRSCNRDFRERLNFLTLRNFLRLGNCSRVARRSRGRVFNLRGRVLSTCKLGESRWKGGKRD